MKAVTTFMTMFLMVGVCAQARVPTEAQQKANFVTCSRSVSHWERNFGRYVVAFTWDKANDICWDEIGANNYRVHAASCSVNGETLLAGYYCDDTALSR